MFAHLKKMKSWRCRAGLTGWGVYSVFLAAGGVAVLDPHLLSNQGQIASWPAERGG